MRFEFPFNEKNAREQAHDYFEYVWKKLLEKNRNSLYYGLTFFFLGVAIIYGRSNLGYVFVVLGGFLLITYLNYHQYHSKQRKTYYAAVERNIQNYREANQPCIWKLEEDYFHYTDYKSELKVQWNNMVKFRIIGDSLILEFTDNIIATFFINQAAIGKEDFKKITEFLANKLKTE